MYYFIKKCFEKAFAVNEAKAQLLMKQGTYLKRSHIKNIKSWTKN